MHIIIYESSAFGGCYNYSIELLEHYSKHVDIESCKLIIPANASFKNENAKNILLNELKIKNKIISRLYFLFRIFVNPFILFLYLLLQKPSIILLNDFEQLSAFVWVPVYRLFMRRHKFAIFLHDIDRDNYPPSYRFTKFSMRLIMNLCQYAFYHDYLPDKEYYRKTRAKYFSVPHGIYKKAEPDQTLLNQLQSFKSPKTFFFSMIGNIRHEKNYHLLIQSLTKFENIKLIIAGLASNSSVNINEFKIEAKKLNVENKIIWIEKYLSPHEISSIISLSDIIVLYYAKTFTSQSAILSQIAEFKKPVLASDTLSSMSQTVKKYGLGELADADSLDALVKTIDLMLHNDLAIYQNGWDNYLEIATWQNHIEIAVNAFKNY